MYTQTENKYNYKCVVHVITHSHHPLLNGIPVQKLLSTTFGTTGCQTAARPTDPHTACAAI